MLVPDTPAQPSSKAIAEQRLEGSTAEKPPPYTEGLTASASAPEAEASKAVIKVPEIQPTNFVLHCTSNMPNKGAYVLDPALHIPPSLLPDLPDGETERKNIFLETNNGSLAADIYLISSEDREASQRPPRASIMIRSQNGSISTKVHRVGSSCPRFSLAASGENGSILVRVPRSFHGPISVTTKNGPIRFSDELYKNLTSVGNIKFLGDFNDYDKKTWKGDEAIVETRNGHAKVMYDDEPVESPLTWLTSLWRTLKNQ